MNAAGLGASKSYSSEGKKKHTLALALFTFAKTNDEAERVRFLGGSKFYCGERPEVRKRRGGYFCGEPSEPEAGTEMPGPVSAMAMPVGRAPSRQSERSATPERVPTPFRDQRSSKTMHKLVLTRLVEEFLWIGGNIVSGSKWKLGLMGKLIGMLGL